MPGRQRILSANLEIKVAKINQKTILPQIPSNGFLFILGKNYHRVWPDTDFAGARQPIEFFLMSLDIRGGMIGKIRTVAI